MTKAKDYKSTLLMIILFGLVACLLYGVGAGLRADIGILLNPLAAHTGIGYDDVSMCIAVMQLIFGASQPAFGILASRRSNRFVLILGACLMGGSLIGMMAARSFAALMGTLGILFGLGAGALSFGLILTSAIHFVGKDSAMIISGMLNASAGMVGFALSPLLQTMLDHGGLMFTLRVLCVVAVCLVPVAVMVTSRDTQRVHDAGQEPKTSVAGASGERPAQRVSDAEHRQQSEEEPVAEESITLGLFQEAFQNRTFVLLFAGFSTCGFHMVIIESHLFSQFILYGISEMKASWAFSVYGIATIAGALLSGYLSTRIHKGRLLGFYYGFRALWVVLYIWILPKNLFTAVLFATGLGFTGDATVSPTSGLVSEQFSIHKVATLIGVLFFTHQVGAFLSAWLGGVVREAFGGYTALWLADIALCAFACIVSLKIKATDKEETKK